MMLGITAEGDIIQIHPTNITTSGAGSDDDWIITGNNIYRNTGFVGIGTDTPTNKLHIVNS